MPPLRFGNFTKEEEAQVAKYVASSGVVIPTPKLRVITPLHQDASDPLLPHSHPAHRPVRIDTHTHTHTHTSTLSGAV
eukprot:9485711-Pyramimonas_sp.AAC.3